LLLLFLDLLFFDLLFLDFEPCEGGQGEQQRPPPPAP
jgi:hypothetical protein